jgi:hypothetical protein
MLGTSNISSLPSTQVIVFSVVPYLAMVWGSMKYLSRDVDAPRMRPVSVVR